ncbi:MAG: hypothetical protein ACRD0H_10175, partial [Actinomycetes bacterium]
MPLGRRMPLGRGRVGRVLARLAEWIEPAEDPSSVIYGTITAGALLAVESTRRETLLEAGAAVLVTLMLLWLAHAYSAALGARLRSGRRQTGREWLGIARAEAALIKGAMLPLGALVVARVAGAPTQTAVVVALVAAAVLLVLLELLAGLRSRLSAG